MERVLSFSLEPTQEGGAGPSRGIPSRQATTMVVAWKGIQVNQAVRRSDTDGAAQASPARRPALL